MSPSQRPPAPGAGAGPTRPQWQGLALAGLAVVMVALAVGPVLRGLLTPPSRRTQVATPTRVRVAPGPRLCRGAGGLASGALQLFPPDTGWVLGAAGAGLATPLLWTGDGGAHWRVASPPGGGTVYAACFASARSGWVVTWHPNTAAAGPFRLWSTADAGHTWQPGGRIPVPAWYAGAPQSPGELDFVNAKDGWLFAPEAADGEPVLGLLFATRDGGRHWTARPGPYSEPEWVRFTASQTGFGPRLHGPWAEALVRTVDGGRTWAPVQGLPAWGYQARCDPSVGLPTFVSASRGWVPVAWAPGPLSRATGCFALAVYATRDGGRHWSLADVAPHLIAATRFLTLEVVGPRDWIVPGDPAPVFYRSVDGGHHWAAVRMHGLAGLQPTGPPRFVTGTLAWLGAMNPRTFRFVLLRSRDGGRDWRPVRIP